MTTQEMRRIASAKDIVDDDRKAPIGAFLLFEQDARGVRAESLSDSEAA
jgi:hypothetical protein